MNETMQENVRQFVVGALSEMEIDVSGVSSDMSLGPEGLDLESLTLIELAMQIEETFGVKFPEDETERIAMMTIAEFSAEVAERAALVQSGGTTA